MRLVDLSRFIQYGDLPTSYYTKRGMVVGENFNRQSNTKFDPSHCWLIRFGNNVTVSNGVIVLAHDDSPRLYTEYGYVGAVDIGDNVFLGARSIILPGITIGNDSIIGAGSIVTKSVLPGIVVAGNPAKEIGTTVELAKKAKKRIQDKEVPLFDYSWTIYSSPPIDMIKKQQMRDLLKNKKGLQYLGRWKD